MSWSDAYLGIPHRDLGRDRRGCDCWGLIRLVYAGEMGIDLPAYDGDYPSALESREVASLVDQVAMPPVWVPVSDPRPMDVLIFRRGPWRSHVGLVVTGTAMLHMSGSGSRIEASNAPRWVRRLTGIMRHCSRLEAAA